MNTTQKIPVPLTPKAVHHLHEGGIKVHIRHLRVLKQEGRRTKYHDIAQIRKTCEGNMKAINHIKATGGKTVVHLINMEQDKMWVGEAVCSSTDQYDKRAGAALAFHRAKEAMLGVKYHAPKRIGFGGVASVMIRSPQPGLPIDTTLLSKKEQVAYTQLKDAKAKELAAASTALD